MEHGDIERKGVIPNYVMSALGSAVAYFIAYKLNIIFFASLELTPDVNWVYLPSGLRLLLVLVLVSSGAVGISIASCFINYLYGSSDQHVFNIVTSAISGFAPLIARQISIDFFKFNTNLIDLNQSVLFRLSITFALVSGLLHQCWFYWIGVTDSFTMNSFAMVVGDWFGTVLVLASASLALRFYRALTSPR